MKPEILTCADSQLCSRKNWFAVLRLDGVVSSYITMDEAIAYEKRNSKSITETFTRISPVDQYIIFENENKFRLLHVYGEAEETVKKTLIQTPFLSKSPFKLKTQTQIKETVLDTKHRCVTDVLQCDWRIRINSNNQLVIDAIINHMVVKTKVLSNPF